MSCRHRSLLIVALLAIATPLPALQCETGLIAAHPDDSYLDHGDGSVSDRRSGLRWKRCAEGQAWDGNACTGTASTHTWAQALALAEAASFAGFDDWRLPNLKELHSLAETCRRLPAINDTLFPDVPGGYFWSSTPHRYYAETSWVLGFADGLGGVDLRSNDNHVRLVRGD